MEVLYIGNDGYSYHESTFLSANQRQEYIFMYDFTNPNDYSTIEIYIQ